MKPSMLEVCEDKALEIAAPGLNGRKSRPEAAPAKVPEATTEAAPGRSRSLKRPNGAGDTQA